MTNETRIWHVTTSVLEEACLDYIKLHTMNGKFIGDVRYLISYQNLNEYNRTNLLSQ